MTSSNDKCSFDCIKMIIQQCIKHQFPYACPTPIP
uniref:Uncharacterized protein n=1 Tax=Rhizophora mucronata TaxID=61149 RepID=A0A2P2QN74_RHIMU